MPDIHTVEELERHWMAAANGSPGNKVAKKKQGGFIPQPQKGIRGVGQSTKDKIIEILTTGKLLKLENFQNDKKVQCIISFANIWGVGSKTAHQLYNKGYRSIEDLRKSPDVLTGQQKIGMAYCTDKLYVVIDL